MANFQCADIGNMLINSEPGGLDSQLSLVIQPDSGQTYETLIGLGFAVAPAASQLLYKYVEDKHLPDCFSELGQCVSDISQTLSRFTITRSPLDSKHLLIEFLDAQPLSNFVACYRYNWFLQLFLDNQEFFFEYQPIVEMPSGKVIAHECLVRAISTEGDYLSAGRLIEAAEATGLIHEFDQAARETCLEAIAALDTESTFFINIIPNSILNHPHFLDDTVSKMHQLGIKPEQIVFELTEKEALNHRSKLAAAINKLRVHGFRIAVDDLYGDVASDHYMMELHPDIIKLDRRLVSGCGSYPMKQILIKSLITSAHEMGIELIAEGLEDQEDIDFCLAQGVDFGQGFGIARPHLLPYKKMIKLAPFNHLQAL
jgi:EAL domain-containing protein (putative c-di-GMP-specific phosphodiesterase class I)